ncbi:hypothetical protein SNEBB_010656 [Seison nebaliae]|nr:hypothetical protein SNEBB_010656 [Seison nebaliae]
MNTFPFYIFLFLTIHSISSFKTDYDPLSYKEIDIDKLNEEWTDEEKDEDVDEKPIGAQLPLNDNEKDKISNREKVLKYAQSAKSTMLFVNINGNDNMKRTEELGEQWAAELFNDHLNVKTFIPEANKLIYLLMDGLAMVRVKDHLLTKEEVIDVTIDNQKFSTKTNDNAEL